MARAGALLESLRRRLSDHRSDHRPHRLLDADQAANLALALILAATVVEGSLLLAEIGSNGANGSFHLATSVVLLVIMLAAVVSFALLRRRVDRLQKLSASMEAALRAKEAAEAANVVKARYLANVSHEIRSPLNAIYGYAQLVEQQGDINPKQAARVIRRCSEHITSLAESLLDISQLESGQLRVRSEPVSLPDFLDQIGWMMRPAAEAKGLTFSVEAVGRLPDVVRTDPGRLRQALLNIIGNAIKFTSTGGVTMRVSYRGQVATIAISDTGPGISPEDQQRIFEPYEQVEQGRESDAGGAPRLRAGVGLGLPITKAIVEILGGNVRLESTPGQGTCFTVTLMMAEPINALRAEAVSRRVIGYEGEPRTILVVDDEADQRALLEHFLGDCGFTVVCAASGEEALRAFAAGTFDLVLLDISMPGMTGWETAARIRAMAGRPVLIAMASANVHEFHRPDFANPTHDHFFVKPYRLDDLAEGIGALLGLSWKYARTDSGAEPALPRPGGLPPRALEHVERLRERIHIGHVRGIEAEIALLANAAPSHGRLVTALYAALDEFDLAGLLRLLEEA